MPIAQAMQILLAGYTSAFNRRYSKFIDPTTGKVDWHALLKEING